MYEVPSAFNISSIATQKGTGHVAYTASKGAIRSMARVLASKFFFRMVGSLAVSGGFTGYLQGKI